jgi:release factor glutamine methyltransferase
VTTVGEALEESVQTLRHSEIDGAHLDARLIVAHGLNMTSQQIFGYPEKQLEDGELERVRKLVARRSQHEPVALITGEKEFWSLLFKVTAATLIPRPGSETLIEAVLAAQPDKKASLRILDLGTGSGCLLLALLHEYENSTGIGIDFSEDALKVARCNGENLGLGGRADFTQADWNNGIPGLADFDIIVSNPPYVAEDDRGTLSADVVDYEPDGALFAGHDGLREYKTILTLLADLTNVTGNVFFEVGINQADVVAEMLEKSGLKDISIHPDLAGIGRCVAAKM